MASELTPFKIADLLDSEAAIQEYLLQVAAEGDADEIIRAQSHVQAALAQYGRLVQPDPLSPGPLYSVVAR